MALARAADVSCRVQCSNCHSFSRTREDVSSSLSRKAPALQTRRPTGGFAKEKWNCRQRCFGNFQVLNAGSSTLGLSALLRRLEGTSNGRLPRGRSSRRLVKVQCSGGKEEEKKTNVEDNGGKGVATITEEKEPKADEKSSATDSSLQTDASKESKASKEATTTSDAEKGKEKEPLSLQDAIRLDAFNVLELLGPEKVYPKDVKLLKEKVFGYTTFWVTKTEPTGEFGEGTVFIGNLRGERSQVYAKLRAGVQELFGSEKYDLFMVEEEDAEGEDARGGPRVSFKLFRKEVNAPAPTSVWQYLVAAVLLILTGGACLEVGLASQVSRLPPEVVAYFSNPDVDVGNPPELEQLLPFVESALPLAYGVFGVQAFHEVGHWLAASAKKVKLSIPFLIPSPTLGSFGAVTQFKSLVPDRTSKFDIAVSGPLAGALFSLSLVALGLTLSDPASPDLVQVPAQLFEGSLLLGLISRAALGFEAMHRANVSIHPLVIAGWCGFTTQVFNMLPAGRIDGGRAVQAAFGKGTLAVTSVVTYLLLGLGLLGGDLALSFGLYILIVQRRAEKPCLDDVTDVGKVRRGLHLAALAVCLVTLLPVFPQMAEDLGIGINHMVM
ncbi:membrane-associated Zn-dependent protease [Klebsormidium nitens]|uniref:Membrane-associated Zn-dependent protease n=1 Tax=Klebsormidium nitens TaxID=105231 RepID=A0A1Y1IG66_KLENI|nr:membrane-associated Zn-dependent protease [Klebsormidium nitens]|eukprot:GAQ88499.1 membrane-associated Zn-dependent protease [Klebsormidium nitens]